MVLFMSERDLNLNPSHPCVTCPTIRHLRDEALEHHETVEALASLQALRRRELREVREEILLHNIAAPNAGDSQQVTDELLGDLAELEQADPAIPRHEIMADGAIEAAEITLRQCDEAGPHKRLLGGIVCNVAGSLTPRKIESLTEEVENRCARDLQSSFSLTQVVLDYISTGITRVV